MKTVVFRRRDSDRPNTWAIHLPPKECEISNNVVTGFTKQHPCSVGIIDTTKLIFDPKTRTHVLEHNILVDTNLCKPTRNGTLFYMFQELIATNNESISHVSMYKLLAFGLQCKMCGFIDGLVAKSYGALTSIFVRQYSDDENMDALQNYQKDSNCDFALLTTFHGAVCYVVENLFMIDTSIHKIKVRTCLKLIHLFMKSAKEMQKQSDTTLLNAMQYTCEPHAEEAHVLIALGMNCHLHLEVIDDDDESIDLENGKLYFIPSHTISCITMTSITPVPFVHIVVKIETSKKRKHELVSEVTCLVRDATIIKPHVDESESQSTVEENIACTTTSTEDHEVVSQNMTKNIIKKNNMREAGFEPAKLYAVDLKSTPFDHSGTHA